MIKETAKIINEIASIDGKGSIGIKLDIIKQNLDNDLLKDIFAFNFDKKITTKISIKKLNKEVDLNKADVKIYDIYDYMSFLKNDCSGKISDIATIKTYINYCRDVYNEEVSDMVRDLAMKKIKLGTLGRKGLAKAYGDDFLFKVESMGGESYLKYKDHKDIVGKDLYFSLKLDGFRLHIFLNEDDTIDTYSRSGLKQEGFDIIEQELISLGYPKGYVVDCEVRLPKKLNENAGACFLRSQKVFASDGQKIGLEARVFDIIPIKDFMKGSCGIMYEDRRSLIEAQNTSDMVCPTKIVYVGNDEKIIYSLLVKIVEEWQEEGLIAYVEGTPWKALRTRHILKYKPYKDVDLRIIGFKKGKENGDFSNTLGTILVQWKENSVVGVGTGLDIPLRDEIWNNQEKYLGKIIEVRFLQESRDSTTGKPSLRHTSLMRFRDDKATVNFEY